MLQRLERRDAVFTRVDEQLGDQVLGLLADVLPLGLIEGVLPLQHGLNDLLVRLPVEGWVPAEQDVKDHAARPEVALLVVALLQHFRGDVVRRAKFLCHFPSRDELPGGPKVNDGDTGVFAVFVEEEVLGLKVSVDNVAAVAVVDGGEHLLDDVRGVLLAEVLLLRYAVEELAAIAKPRPNGIKLWKRAPIRPLSVHLLCNEEVPLVVLEELVQLQDVWVVHLLQDADLGEEALLLLLF